MAFMRPALSTGEPPFPLAVPPTLRRPDRYPQSLAVEALGLYRAPVRSGADGGMQVIDWAEPILKSWQFGEEAAKAQTHPCPIPWPAHVIAARGLEGGPSISP